MVPVKKEDLRKLVTDTTVEEEYRTDRGAEAG